MKHSIRLALACLVVLLTVKQSRAADNAPALAQQGKQLFADDFARAEMVPKWRVGKGFFTVKDGVVSIAENPDDHHGAYAYVTPHFPFKDIVAEFSVKIVGDEMLMSIDGKPVGYLKSEGIAHPTKDAIGFEVGGKTVLVKDFKVWEATPASDWQSHREAVIASLSK